MKIQSLSIVVPTKKCINDCKFCVAKTNDSNTAYKNMLDENLPFYDLYEKEYIKRLEFARDNGCNTIMLTGDGEPPQNKLFLQRFGTINRELKSPFKKIEMQTTGVMLDKEYLRFLRNHVGVSTISLSLSSLDDMTNKNINGINDRLYFNMKELCNLIKEYDFNLRLSLNMTSWFHSYSNNINILFEDCKNLGADQITFRVLYESGLGYEQDEWIKENRADDELITQIRNFILDYGTPLELLEYGGIKYDVYGMSTVMDADCMNKELKEELKYLILRPNCKLYSKWDSKASLIF